MRKVNVAEDIVPIAEFKTHASELIRRLHAHGRPMIITQNGRARAVVLTPEEFDALAYHQLVKLKIEAGLEGAKRKRYSAAQVRKRLRARATPTP